MDTTQEAKKQSPKNLRCANCMRVWKQSGKKPEEMPEKISQQDLKDGLCPVCEKQFRNYCPF